MPIKTIIIGDLKESTSQKNSTAFDILEKVNCKLPATIEIKNTWGDAFVAAFDEASTAVRYCLDLRDSIAFFDWRSIGIRKPLFFRLAISTGEVGQIYDSIMEKKSLEGVPFVKAARIEPNVEPGSIVVDDNTRNIISNANNEFFWKKLTVEKFKGVSSPVIPFEVFRSADEAKYRPLRDEQHFRREDVLRRFAYLWLILDQLPLGSWGRSVPLWMRNVWKNYPTISVNPVMEVEGGFETTILNMVILSQIHGPYDTFEMLADTAVKYLKQRQVPSGGFGTMGYSRDGFNIDAQPRHTALATWFLGNNFLLNGIHPPEVMEMFEKGVHALFLGDKASTLTDFLNERNPVLLYMTSWHIIQMINDSRMPRTISNTKEIMATWEYIKDKLIFNALKSVYEPIPPYDEGDEHSVYPLTVPYGNFSRMECYSFLTAAQFLDSRMPNQIKERFQKGIEYLLKRYLQSADMLCNRYSYDSLRTRLRGPYPYFSKISMDVPHPDIGTASLLLRALRSKKLVAIIWPNEVPQDVHKARYFLSEDIVDLFDRYLEDQKLFSLTHAGMFANFLVEDDRQHLHYIIGNLKDYLKERLPVDLTDKTIETVLSEKLIVSLVNKVVTDDKLDLKVQTATFSLSRLLLDYLRPGRYIQERITYLGRQRIAAKTLDIYNNPTFAERFIVTWKDNIAQAMLAPFLAKLNKNSHILDVGSGAGQYAEAFIANEHRVSLIDGSEPLMNFVRIRIKNLCSVEPIHFLCDISSPHNRSTTKQKMQSAFDAIWCSGLLVHIPKTGLADMIRWFNSILKYDGILFVNFMIDNPRVFANDGRFYTYYTEPGEFLAIVEACGFAIEQTLTSTLTTNTYNEPLLHTHWINVYARKTTSSGISMDKEAFDDHYGEYSSVLTAHAYQRSTPDFVKVHSLSKGRSTVVNKDIDTLSGYLKGKLDVTVFDAGCGPGDHVKAMAERGWKVYGIDISNEMIEYAKKNNQSFSLVELQVGDIVKLPLDWNNKFDAVISVTVFQHLIDRKAIQVLKEFHRVLKVDGILRIDVQIGRERGYDPDLRFIEGYSNREDALKRLSFEEIGFELLKAHEWELPKGQNTFERPIAFRFAEFWLTKR